jgi:diguanylate cyclase (GGDEF)-like protein/PAS domain S-box-containing protein
MSTDLGPAEHEIYRAAIEASPVATIVTDADGMIALANREAERLFAYDAGVLIGRPIEALVPEAAQGLHPTHRMRYATEPALRLMGALRDLQARRESDGAVFPVEVGLNPVRTSRGLFVVCTIVDLTERKRAEERLAQQAMALKAANERLVELATTDSLTTLWNRRAFLDQLDIQLEMAVRSAHPMSVLIVDVDHFKPYNDQYGHLAGDEVLRSAARVFRTRARRSDFVARIGGEEFGVILHDANREGARRAAEQLRQAVEEAQWPRRRITVSVGAATVAFPAPVPRPASPGRTRVLSAADRALYYSKEQGRNRVTHADDLAPVM